MRRLLRFRSLSGRRLPIRSQALEVSVHFFVEHLLEIIFYSSYRSSVAGLRDGRGWNLSDLTNRIFAIPAYFEVLALLGVFERYNARFRKNGPVF